MKITSSKKAVLSAVLIPAFMFAAIPGEAKDPKPSVDAIISRHLDSIGTAEARANAISRVSQGKVVFAETIQHSLRLEGSANLLSQERKQRCEFQFANPQYPGEQFVFDGNKGLVGMVDQTSRSRLGNFLFLQEE